MRKNIVGCLVTCTCTIIMNIVLSIDISGSVGGDHTYWNRVRTEYDAVSAEPNLQILAWGSNCSKITRDTLVRLISERRGDGGGTCPQSTASFLKKMGTIDRLVFITDGQICGSEVGLCDMAMADIRNKIAAVSCHIVSRSPDVSVTTPFTRGIDAVVTTHNPSTNESSQVFRVTTADYILLGQIDTISLDTFEAQYKTITDAILSLTIGTTGSPELANRLITLKRRLTAEFAAKQTPDMSLTDALDANAANSSTVLIAQNIVDKYYDGGEAKTINSKLDYIINLAQGGSQSYSVSQFNIAAHDRAPVARVVEPESAIDCELTDSNVVFECPVSYGEEEPVITVIDGPPLLMGLPKNVIEAIIRNPLAILNNAEVCNRIRLRVKNAIGFGTFMQLRNSTNKDPWTSEQFAGCIPLNACSTHMAVTDSALFNLFVGGKRLGNVDLYFAVIWRLVARGDIPWLTDVAPHLTAQMSERMRVRKSSLSLSGMPNMVTTRMSLGTAVWFVLASGVLKMDNDVVPLRTHIFVADTLVELAKLANYTLSEEMTDAIRLTRELLCSLSACKQDEQFYNTRRALYHSRRYVGVRGTYIFLDGEVDFARGKEMVGNCSVAELAYIASIVDPSLSASKLATPTTAEVDIWWKNVGSKPVANWIASDKIHKPVYVHPATCRPLYNVVVDGVEVDWTQAYESHYGHSVTCKILSGNKAIGQWVCDHLAWPTADDLIKELFAREQRICSKNPTLQADIWNALNSTLADFADIFASITPAEFKVRFNRSVSRVGRARIELM
jgi:hypothetical protein